MCVWNCIFLLVHLYLPVDRDRERQNEWMSSTSARKVQAFFVPLESVHVSFLFPIYLSVSLSPSLSFTHSLKIWCIDFLISRHGRRRCSEQIKWKETRWTHVGTTWVPIAVVVVVRRFTEHRTFVINIKLY